MKCLNCGKPDTNLLCENCRTEKIVNEILYAVFCGYENNNTPFIKELVESYPANELFEIILQLSNLLPDDIKEPYELYYYLHYQREIDIEEKALEYLEKNDLTKRGSQMVIAALIMRYVPDNLFRPQKWCEYIWDTDGLCFELYYLAANYFIKIGEYDKSKLLIKKAREYYSSDWENRCTLFKLETINKNIDELEKKIITYQNKRPYWPKTDLRCKQVAYFYDMKGIKYPNYSAKLTDEEIRNLNYKSDFKISTYKANAEEEKEFDFGAATEEQKKAISTTEGPVLIIAGPGTGKTFTLVLRVVYLIEVLGVKPEEIMITTFSKKAAKELTTRISNTLAQRNISININDMYIGTFHSICLKIIDENIEYSNWKRNYGSMESFDQDYFVYTHYKDVFSKIEGIDKLFDSIENKRDKNATTKYNGKPNPWGRAKWIVSNCLAKTTEELVTAEELIGDSDELVQVVGRIVQEYNKLLKAENMIDFSSMQVEAYRLLNENPSLLKEIQSKIKYIMIDEYQDTNYIQEQLSLLLAGERKNLCVVGDDDQGLYRFRGATVRNILEFTDKFKNDECKVIKLEKNFRSNDDIINFYNKWMRETNQSSASFEWGRFRLDKEIIAGRDDTIAESAVFKLHSDMSEESNAHFDKIAKFIKRLYNSGKITDYNQIAFLSSSVASLYIKDLQNYLEKEGIGVYSPRSYKFFERLEIKLAVGILLLVFPDYVADIEHNYLPKELVEYFALRTPERTFGPLHLISS